MAYLAREQAEAAYNIHVNPSLPMSDIQFGSEDGFKHHIVKSEVLSQYAERMRRYRNSLKSNPQKWRRYLDKQSEYNKKYNEKVKTSK